MLENLTKNITKILNNITGKKKISEENIKDILNKLRKSLIEADVSWNVIKTILNNIKNSLTNIEITKKLSPGKILFKIINDEFINILDKNKFQKENFLNKNNLNVALLIGMQGSGKTTSIVKLARYLKAKYKRKPLLISCDIYRPAAEEQLFFLSKKASVDYFSFSEKNERIDSFLEKAIAFSKNNGYDYLLIDSAGRTHVNNEMMTEVLKIIEISKPDEILFVIDAMIGQNAIEIIENFSKKIKISGFVLTKIDSDTKGGVMLSLGYSTKIPIKFIGTGENINDFEIFNSRGITSRILGTGDMIGLIENYQIANEETKEIKDFNLENLQAQMKKLIEFGSIKSMVEKIPGYHLLTNETKEKNNENFKKTYSIINSMTKKEKLKPDIINGSRKKRIAKGAGVDILSVNKVLKVFNKIKETNVKL